MKTNIPNQLINLQTNKMFEKSNVTMRIKVMLLLMFAMICANMSAQVRLESEDAPVIRELNTFLNSERGMRLSSSNTYSDVKNLEDLISNVQPSVYFYSGNVKTYGEKPKNLFTDLSSLSQLSNPSILKNNIEIIIISISNSSELNGTLDMSLFSSYKNLKYIFLTSKVNVSDRTISRMIQNNNEKYSVFFRVEDRDTNQ
ncbi:hypothetical protein [Flavobacterium dankookense]|uniref:Uncharacterized protein n=1 Tax=Flavobacterium dankookense TaxID=706186 RepID=A0A4R6QJM5_9FLAO|nr:hypothetical protein [Flavobacterium dankookense]TDP61925.1 hypothetical protein BC748_0035 [Flavobacterium dankookense]